MATVISNRTTTIVYAGGVVGSESISATQNSNSPGNIQIITLASGFNSIAVPGGGTLPTAVIIIPPAGNSTQITLKGITGDTGIILHPTDHSVIALNSAQTTIGLTAAAQIVGLTLMWT